MYLQFEKYTNIQEIQFSFFLSNSPPLWGLFKLLSTTLYLGRIKNERLLSVFASLKHCGMHIYIEL